MPPAPHTFPNKLSQYSKKETEITSRRTGAESELDLTPSAQHETQVPDRLAAQSTAVQSHSCCSKS